ncbi:30S ribosomal protein S5 [Candidatus Peregrinibacteria bacterium]|nr:30S ribosomal protein S5 [Candidatus Peregrinibacteria bacterium]
MAQGRPAIRKEVKEFDEEVIQIDRVTRVVKGGRKMRFRATVAIGNHKGKVGIGVGKSGEVTGAIQKAIAKAKKHLLTVKLDGSTIPHEVKLKFKSARVLLMPAGPGTGLIAGSSIRQVLELVGVKDILSKSLGTSNKVNTTKAAFEALKLLRTTPRMLARQPVATVASKASNLSPVSSPSPSPSPQPAKAPKQQ